MSASTTITDKVPQTAVAIDTAIKRAMESRKTAMKESVVKHDRVLHRISVTDFMGKTGSYERGFILSTMIMVSMLAMSRVVIGSHPLVGIVIPMIMLAATLAWCIKNIRKQASSDWLRSRIKPILVGVGFMPYLTLKAGSSINKTHKAVLWTSWLALVIGTLTAIIS